MPIDPRRPPAWARLIAWLEALSAAFETSADDLQDRRIAALEREVDRLRQRWPAHEDLAPPLAPGAAAP